MTTQTKKRKVPGIKHGTTTSYTYHGCRCKRCQAAWATYQAKLRARRFGEGTQCRVKGCKRHPWAAAGNGLCHVHHAALKEIRAKKTTEKAPYRGGPKRR